MEEQTGLMSKTRTAAMAAVLMSVIRCLAPKCQNPEALLHAWVPERRLKLGSYDLRETSGDGDPQASSKPKGGVSGMGSRSVDGVHDRNVVTFHCTSDMRAALFRPTSISGLAREHEVERLSTPP